MLLKPNHVLTCVCRFARASLIAVVTIVPVLASVLSFVSVLDVERDHKLIATRSPMR